MEVALYQPDIPQNVGGALRLAACMGVRLHIIEPCGFILDDKRIRRAGMDYMERVEQVRHASWDAFLQNKGAGRLVLLTTKASMRLERFTFLPDDILLVGRESAGVPEEVAEQVDAQVVIPMCENARSLNVTVSLGMVLWVGLQQTGTLP